MDLATEAVAALAAPAPVTAKPQPTAQQQMAILSIRRNAGAALHALENVANALWYLRSDIRNEHDALFLTDVIVVLEDVRKRFAPPPKPAEPSPHPMGRFARDDRSCRGGD